MGKVSVWSMSPVAIRMTWTALPITSAGRFSPLESRGMASDPWMISEGGSWAADPMPNDAALSYQPAANRVYPLLVTSAAKELLGKLSLSQAGPAKHQCFDIVGNVHAPI
jgi:hypothetical protein